MLRAEPGVGDAVADRPEHGEPHGVLPRARALHLHGREGGRLAEGGTRRDDSGVVGGVLVGAGAVQHGDGPGRGPAPAIAAEGGDLGQRPLAGDAEGGRRERSTPRATFRGFRRSGSDGSSSWAEARVRARSAWSPRSETW